MKSIELTETHKSKLLEMCKELFPEYTIYSADNDGFIEGEQWVGDQNMGEDRPVNEFNIHWFEFIISYLFPKLELTSVSHMIFSKKHPVDYLYQRYKLLKQ